MFKKVKEYFQKKKQLKDQKEKFDKTKAYYETLRKGVAVLQYIQKDLADKANKMNRMERRRMETFLNKKGKFSPEIIAHYEKEFEKILTYLDKQ